MLCPYCNEEMQKGCIDQGRFALEWRSRLPGDRWINDMREKRIKLSSIWKSGSVIVHYCEKCGKFIIDQEELDV
nr:hypothetical protein [Oscillospiraceae bacterium]